MRLFYQIPLGVLCLIIGAYPLFYLFGNSKTGLLEMKSDALVMDSFWRFGFYTHIACGGVALSIGWSQFVTSLRNHYLKYHRAIGKLYVLMVCLSAMAAIGISPMTSTGWVAAIGFGILGLIWLCVTLQAYKTVRQKNFDRHRKMMVYSYSACCAAVTLRLWLPLLMGVLRLEFSIAYPIVAWLCWIPNLLVAHWINSRVLPQVANSNGFFFGENCFTQDS